MALLPAPKIIVFDLDGVLIDSAEANYQAFAYGLEQIGRRRPEREAVLSLVGLKAGQMLERLGCPPHLIQATLTDWVRPFYLENLPTLARPMAGAAQVLTELKDQGYRILACTSGDRRTQTAALKAVDLWGAIEALQAADDSAYGKPDPRYLQELLAPYSYQTLLHVEDAEVGIRMGQACGAVSIFAEYGFGALPPDLRVDYRLQALTELPAIAARF